MKTIKRILIAVLIVALGLGGYEYFLLRRAQAKTEDVFKPYVSAEFRGLKWLDLNERQRDILIKVEDPGFFTHNGIDFFTDGAGFTTITQAVVKKLYFDHFTPGFKKIEQSLIARYAVTPVIPKEVQLTAFLNVAYFGEVDNHQVKGFSEASQTYFKKSISELSDEEFIKLVAMLVAPNDLKPYPNNEKSVKRVTRIKKLVSDQCKAKGLMDIYLEGCD
jgi:membrane peptidoglycan carboxypeptidase